MSNLPATPMADFAQRAAANRRPKTRAEGGYLKFNGKTGEWSLGLDETPVEGEKVLLNSATMMHGWLRWGEMPPAKVFASVAEPEPDKIEPLDGTDYDGRPKTFVSEAARQITGRFVDEELGNMIFNTSSMGGVERMDELFDKILLKAADGTPYCYPLVELESDFYKRSTGKVYKPVFKVAAWCDQNGEPETEAKLAAPKKAKDPEPEPEQEDDTPRRRRRRTKAA